MFLCMNTENLAYEQDAFGNAVKGLFPRVYDALESLGVETLLQKGIKFRYRSGLEI